MAQMIPDEVPAGKSNGERLLFSRLQLLPDDCIVYYEPTINGRCPDFVVIIPDLGLLILEAKGWRASQILGGDSHHVTVRSVAGSETKEANPIRQAREYMHGLMNACQKHPSGQRLAQDQGIHKGKFIFPFGSCAILTQITEAELQGHPAGNLRAFLPQELVVAADEFEHWIVFTGAQLKDRLASFFNPTWSFPRLSVQQIEAIRAIVHPEIRVPPAPASLAGQNRSLTQPRLAEDSRDLKTLDLDQERAARTIGSGHRLLFGVAGSGKTVVLLARARFLSEGLPAGRILVLCFNVSLRTYLREILAPCHNVDVYSFHEWGAQQGVAFQMNEAPDTYGARLLTGLESGRGDAAQYDAVLVDEAQDFDPVWFKCAAAALKEPRTGDLLITGDRNQTHYQRGQLSWSALGIQAKGRSRILRQNYRNTRAILAAASLFADDGETDEGIAATKADPAQASRDLPILPLLIQRASRREETDAIETTVRALLNGSFSPHLPALGPSDVALLYRKKNEYLEGLLHASKGSHLSSG